MKLLFGLIVLALLSLENTESVSYGKFISIEEAPYIVSLLDVGLDDNNVFFCGGSIISEYWIITAAHCVDEAYSQVVLGESVRYEQGLPLTHKIEKVFVHEDYIIDTLIRNNTNMGEVAINDIALIKLKEPIVFNERQQPIKIRKIPPKENDTLIIMGFGDQGDAKGPGRILKQSEVTVVSETTCANDIVSYGLLDVSFCANDSSSDVCQGDSGGPAVINGELAGIVSFGPGCTIYVKKEILGLTVYTRVDAFYDWIVNITGIVL